MDGDDQFRFWARGLFAQQRAGEIVTLSTIDDAKSTVRRHEPHLALLELGRDDAALLVFLAWLRDRKHSPAPDLPLLLLVKEIDKEMLRRVCDFGIHGVLKKPISGELMLKAASSVLRNPRRMAIAAEPPPAAVKPPLAVDPPTMPRPRSVATDQPEAKPVPLRRVSSFVPTGVVSRPTAGGASALSGKGPGGSYGEDSPVAPPIKAKQFLEPLEPAAAPVKAEDDGWNEAPEAKPKAKSAAWDPVPPVPPAADPAPLEPPAAPRPKDGEPVAGRDLDAILEEHARWVRSGGTDGKRANLEGEDLSGRTLADAPLTNAALRRCDLSASDLTNAELHGADLRHAEIIGSQMSGANLAVARLRHAHLRACQMDGVNLKGADLAGADLSGSILDGAEMKGANLLGTILDGADLSCAAGLSQTQLESVTGDAKTRLPPGLYLPSAA